MKTENDEKEVEAGSLRQPCSAFVEDPFVCYDFGEPKGQCANCGFKDTDHEKSAMPPEPENFTDERKRLKKELRAELDAAFEHIANALALCGDLGCDALAEELWPMSAHIAGFSVMMGGGLLPPPDEPNA